MNSIKNPINVYVDGMYETCNDKWGGIYTIEKDSKLHKQLLKYNNDWYNYDAPDWDEDLVNSLNGDGGPLNGYPRVSAPCFIDISVTICYE